MYEYSNYLIENEHIYLLLEDGTEVLPVKEYTVVNNAFSINEDGSATEVFEFDGSINYSQIVRVEIDNIAGINGSWDVEFNLTYHEPTYKKINKEIKLLSDDILYVEAVIFDSFSTIFEMRSNFDIHEKYMITVNSNKNYDIYTEFRTIGINTRKSMLSSGNDGYRMYYIPVPEDSSFTLDVLSYTDLGNRQEFCLE